MTGGTEPILYYRQYGFENVAPSFYKKLVPPSRNWRPDHGVC